MNFEQRETLRKHFKKDKIIALEFRKESEKCHGGGNYHINIMPFGDVTFCPPVPYSYGNILNEPLKDCLLRIKKDHKKFCTTKCTGHCPVNFLEYRENCDAKFIHENAK